MPRGSTRRAQYDPIPEHAFGKCRYAGKRTEEFYDGWCLKSLGCDKYDWVFIDDGVADQPDISRNVHAEHIKVYPPDKQKPFPSTTSLLKRVVRNKEYRKVPLDCTNCIEHSLFVF